MKDRVFAAMDAELAAGNGVPSVRTVRALIGGGSLTDVSNFVRQWKAEHPAVSKAKAKVGFSEEETKTLLEAMWNVTNPIVQALAEARVAEMTAELVEQRKDVDDLRAEALLDAQKAEKDLAQAAQMRTDARHRVEVAEKEMEALKTADAEKTATIEQLKKAVESADREKADLLDRVEEQKALIAMLREQMSRLGK